MITRKRIDSTFYITTLMLHAQLRMKMGMHTFPTTVKQQANNIYLCLTDILPDVFVEQKLMG